MLVLFLFAFQISPSLEIFKDGGTLFPSPITKSFIQTDWSGGPNVLGPVNQFSNLFFQGNVNTSLPGKLVLRSTPLMNPIKETVSPFTNNPANLTSADIDGDGVKDLITFSPAGNYIPPGSTPKGWVRWWKRQQDGSFLAHDAASQLIGVTNGMGADLDQDGDQDIVAATFYGPQEDDRNGRFVWLENVNGSGTQWIEHEIANQFYGAEDLDIGDIDGDGDLDVVGVATLANLGNQNDDVAWFENVDGSGTRWTQHTVDSNFSAAISVQAADIDGDGDLDITAATYDNSGNTVAWWENTDGTGNTGPQQKVTDSFFVMTSIEAADLDGDGDMDIVGGGNGFSPIAFFENIHGDGSLWQANPVGQITFPWRRVSLADMDGDGDLDVLGGANQSLSFHSVAWWENQGGDSSLWPAHFLNLNQSGNNASILGTDLNGDGKKEFVTALQSSSSPQQLFYWEPTEFISNGQLTSSILNEKGPGKWNQISWKEDRPAGTNVTLEVRAGFSPSSMGTWKVIYQSGNKLPSSLPLNAPLIQYRIQLWGKSNISPSLHQIRLKRSVGIQNRGGGIYKNW